MPRTFLPISFLLGILSILRAPAQDLFKADSLYTLLSEDIDDTVRYRLLFDIASEFGVFDTSSAFHYLESGKEIAEKLDDGRGLGRYFKIKGLMSSNLGKYEEAIANYDRALAYFTEADDHVSYFETVKNKGNVYLLMADYSQAMNHYNTALEFYKKNNMGVGISRCLNNMGIIHKNRGEYADALSDYEESILYLDPEKDALDISQGYINMGNVFVYLGSYEQALAHYELALEISQRLKNQKNIALCLSNSGVVQNKCNNYLEALNLYQSSLEVSRSLNDPVQISNCLINIGTNYADMGQHERGLEYVQRGMATKMELGDERAISNCYIYLAEIHVMMEEYDRAIELFNTAIPVKEELGDQEGLIRSYLGLGSVLLDQGQYRAAGTMVERGLDMATAIRAREHLAQGYEILRDIAFALGDYKNAYNYAIVNQQYEDSLMDDATAKAVMEMEFRNRSKALEQENENLRIQSDLTQELMRKRNSFFYSLLGLAVLLATGLALVAYFLRRLRHTSLKLEEKNLVITRQNLKLDRLNKNKDKMMSIIAHDLRGTIGNQLTAIEVIHRLEGEENEGIDQKRLFGNLKHSASYSLELLENLLHWSRLDETESYFYPEEVNLESLIGNCIALFEETASMKHLTIKEKLEGPLTCNVDKIMFETIIRNLISNAIKFSNQGGSINVTASVKDGMIHIKVMDQGIGLNDEQLEKICENGGFTRRGTANEKGAGIGLTLVREFTNLHKGNLHISSKTGEGSSFEVVIPCRN
jgi:signal transduction histidine kinase/predicted negative regulator of RcsB-dependent stress response